MRPLSLILFATWSVARDEPVLQRVLEKTGCSQQRRLEALACALRSLYPERAGFDEESDSVELTYGEITQRGVEQLVEAVPDGLTGDDVFYDLGSGVGKAALQVFLSTPVRRSVGVELAESRHKHAMNALVTLRSLVVPGTAGPDLDVDGRELRFVQGDVLKTDLTGATVLYISSLAMPHFVVQGLQRRTASDMPPGTLAIFSTKLGGCPRGLLFLGRVSLDMTWLPSSAMFIYLTTAPAEAAPSAVPAFVTGLWQMSAAQASRLTQASKASDFWFHREKGEASSDVACDALELEALMQKDSLAGRQLLKSLDLLRKDKAGRRVLEHVCDTHTSSVRSVRLFPSRPGFATHQAAKQKNLREVVRLLLELGFDPKMLDAHGESCISLADQNQDAALLELLRGRAKASPPDEL